LDEREKENLDEGDQGLSLRRKPIDPLSRSILLEKGGGEKKLEEALLRNTGKSIERRTNCAVGGKSLKEPQKTTNSRTGKKSAQVTNVGKIRNRGVVKHAAKGIRASGKKNVTGRR